MSVRDRVTVSECSLCLFVENYLLKMPRRMSFDSSIEDCYGHYGVNSSGPQQPTTPKNGWPRLLMTSIPVWRSHRLPSVQRLTRGTQGTTTTQPANPTVVSINWLGRLHRQFEENKLRRQSLEDSSNFHWIISAELASAYKIPPW